MKHCNVGVHVDVAALGEGAMSLAHKSADAIQEEDLQQLIADQYGECKTIDYKEALPGGKDEERKEYLYDMSSFANAAGGWLVFGMKEVAGVPVDLCGVEVNDGDAEKLRLENMVRDGIQPRINGISSASIRLQNGRTAVVMHIPKSWAMPHMVTFKGASKFYSRNSAGKYPLDVGELRAAFVGAATAAERIKSFRIERLGRIVAGEMPAILVDGAKIVLHCVPFNAFDLATQFDLPAFLPKIRTLLPIGAMGLNYHYNFDGFLTTESHADRKTSYGYVQLFRNGCIEVVDTALLQPHFGQDHIIPTQDFERELMRALPDFLSVHQALGVEPPVFIMLTLLGVSGYKLTGGIPIDRDALIIPEVMIESFGGKPAEILQPLFNVVWNAAGFARSLHYDDQGRWVG